MYDKETISRKSKEMNIDRGCDRRTPGFSKSTGFDFGMFNRGDGNKSSYGDRGNKPAHI